MHPEQVVVQLAGQAEPVAVSYAAGPVIIQDEAGNRYRVDQDGQISEQAGAVAGAGGDAGTGTASGQELSALLAIEREVIAAILTDFEERITAWLQVHGKGPLDQREMAMAEGLPGCLGEDLPGVLEVDQEHLPAARSNLDDFIRAINAQHPTEIFAILTPSSEQAFARLLAHLHSKNTQSH